MITAEMTGNASTVRIHDDYFVSDPQRHMEQLSQIVSRFYKRRGISQSASINCKVNSIDSLM